MKRQWAEVKESRGFFFSSMTLATSWSDPPTILNPFQNQPSGVILENSCSRDYIGNCLKSRLKPMKNSL